MSPWWTDSAAAAARQITDWLAGSVGGQASGSAAVMRWCVASFADGDTHLAEPGSPGQPVAAHCDGRQFSPLAILPGAPLDPEQVCLACRADQPSPAPQTRPRRATADKVTT